MHWGENNLSFAFIFVAQTVTRCDLCAAQWTGHMGADMKKYSATVSDSGKLKMLAGLDSEWFKLQMRRNHLTTRGLGERVGLHYSAIGRMTNGQQTIKAKDVAMFAKAFGVTVEEVMCRAGVEVAKSADTARVPVIGWVDADGLGHVGDVVGPRLVDGPTGGHGGLQALRGVGGASDGWLFFFDTAQGVPAEAVGRLCVVRLLGDARVSGGMLLRWVTKGYEPGVWNLGRFDGQGVESGRLASAAPIVWMRQ